MHPPDSQLPPIPPQDLESERALLGGLFTAHRYGDLVDVNIDEIRSIVGPEAFYLPDHVSVFRAIVAAHDAGEPIDQRGIIPRLEADSLSTTNWAELIHELTIVGEPANSGFYARQVRSCWCKREVIQAASEAIEQAYSPLTGPDEVIATLTKRLDQVEQAGLGDREPRAEPELLRSIENPRNATGDKVPVAIGWLGRILDGGLERGTLTVVGARPSCGKTSLGLGLCVHASRATDGCPSMFISVEMSVEQVGLRLLSMRSGMPVRAIRAGEIEDAHFHTERNKAALVAENGHPIYLLDGITDVRAIASYAKRYVRKHGVKLVVVDYLGLCSLTGRFDRHDLKIGAMSALFKGLARDTEAAVVLLSQLSRASDKENRRPKLSDLRDSGSLEQDADVVVLIHRGKDESGTGAREPKKPKPEPEPLADTTLIVAKQRQGSTGDALVCYRKATMSYEARHVGPEF